MSRRIRIPALLAAGTLLLTACGDDDAAEPAAGDSEGFVGGPGVTAEQITLGVLSDRTGPFKSFGVNFGAGQDLWAEDVNAAGGVCERSIRIERRDHGYKAEQAKLQFGELEPKVAGFLELLGSPMLAALKGDLADQNVTAVAAAFSSFLLEQPHVVVPGATYDLEIVNALSHLLSEEVIAEGDTIGHIYIEGEYGGNALLGARFMADRHDLELVEKKVTPADADMANIVTGFRGDDVAAILLSTAPPQTASAAAANAQLGLDVPLVGNSPAFDPALFATPAADALAGMYVAGSSVPFAAEIPKVEEVAGDFRAAFPDLEPTFSVQFGYAIGLIWQQILERACDAGDLSRDGIFAAKNASTTIETEGLTPVLDFSVAGAPPSREIYLAVVDEEAAGGLRVQESLYASEAAEDYRAPGENE